MSRHQPSAVQQGSCPALAQSFWLQWVEKAFPNLDSQAYFIPPVYVNRVPMARWSTAGRDVLVLQSAPGQAGQTMQASSPSPSASQVSLPQDARISDSDVRDDAAMQRVFCCLQKMAEQNGEVLVGLSQLQFGQYLSESCYAAAAAQLPLPASLPPSLPRKWKRGDFDVLLIHQTYGFVVCEVKAFGDNVAKLNMTNKDIENNIRKKLTQAVSQLDKSQGLLSHLVSDITSGLRITKTIAVPNLTVLGTTGHRWRRTFGSGSHAQRFPRSLWHGTLLDSKTVMAAALMGTEMAGDVGAQTFVVSTCEWESCSMHHAAS
ncbi:uncharacterized protein LOC112572090 [Pomacea canaliculata]|uniref:uncharacterized protein LOC112572090 n=1 Tax=Pomacea canaliculata TaxID=400727 RepID=UPI000D7283C4|nr:uncharacterized protein LOC112572090 [Pomacea canaliculata]